MLMTWGQLSYKEELAAPFGGTCNVVVKVFQKLFDSHLFVLLPKTLEMYV